MISETSRAPRKLLTNDRHKAVIVYRSGGVLYHNIGRFQQNAPSSAAKFNQYNDLNRIPLKIWDDEFKSLTKFGEKIGRFSAILEAEAKDIDLNTASVNAKKAFELYIDDRLESEDLKISSVPHYGGIGHNSRFEDYSYDGVNRLIAIEELYRSEIGAERRLSIGAGELGGILVAFFSGLLAANFSTGEKYIHPIIAIAGAIFGIGFVLMSLMREKE